MIAEKKEFKKISGKQLFGGVKDAGYIFVASVLIALAYHVFIISNGFAPGGVSGIATMIGYLLKSYLSGAESIFILALNLPICVAVFFIVKKKAGVILILYIFTQSLALYLLEMFKFPVYVTDNTVLPALAGGVVSGVGYAMIMRRFGILGGTFAISMLIKKKKPTMNAVWISFGMDSVVVAASFFVYNFNPEPVLCTLINLFVASKIIDVILTGVRSAYKYEIFTNDPEKLAAELIQKLKHGVSLVPAVGMYTHEPRSLLICVVRKRDVAEFYKILKAYPDAFVYIINVNEVMGNFK